MTLSYSPRLDAALVFAARAHRTQLRKGTDIPYVVHPTHVAIILLRHGFDEDLVIAGVLHDTVEDTGATPEAIAGAFGPGVAALVLAVTELKAEGGEPRPWRIRKEEQLEHLRSADHRVAALKAADALHNAMSTVADLRSMGAAAWGRFNAPPAELLWYYRELVALVRERLGDHALTAELAEVIEEMAAMPMA